MKHHFLVCLLLAILAVHTIEASKWSIKQCTKANFGGTCSTFTMTDKAGSGCFPIEVKPLLSFKVTIPKNCAFNLWSGDGYNPCTGPKLGHATKTWQVNTVSPKASKAGSFSMEGQGC